MHLNRSKTQKIYRNSLRNFPLHGFSKKLHWFRCSGKGKHLNLEARQNPTAKTLTTNTLQDFQRPYPWFRSLAGWNAAECKCALDVLLAGVSAKRAAEQPMHLNRSRTQKIYCNSLKNFLLHGFGKHLLWFRCGGNGKHLNLEARQNPAAKTLTTNALQDSQQLCPWFRSQVGLEGNRLQMCPGCASGWGILQTRNRTAQASEPERNSNKPPQHIERLVVVPFQQAPPLVQMQR